VTYIAMLEAYDVFQHDFDFERISGYRYAVRSSLPFLRREVESAIVVLKEDSKVCASLVERKARNAELRARFDNK